MAVEDHSLSTPLLSSQKQPHVIVTVHDGPDHPQPEPLPESNPRALFQSGDDNRHNPFAFIGAHDGFEVPGSSTVDPFRNHTPHIEGLYEWLKIVVCLPIAAVRLVLFGLCLTAGYLTTRLALYGWKDRQNPMPKWRCRMMWVTRLCGRAILFSFGYHWIKRKGKPAPREIAPIIVSNHVSYIDPIFFFYEFFPTIVSSDSHDSMPFVGTIIRAMQVIYVDRFSKSSRKHAVNEIKKLFDTEMSFQGSENREKLLAISFLACSYFLKEQQATGEFLYPSKLARSFLAIPSSQLLFDTPMYTLTSPGGISHLLC